MKVAFMFLLYDKIQHAQLWEDFFSNGGDKYNIYSHPKIINENTPDWIIKNKVKTVNTGWCTENLVKALCQMLKKALKDKNNTHFVFLSGTCIPLYDFNETYKKITRSKKSRMNYKLMEVYDGYVDYWASQWVILNRKVAKDLIRIYNNKDKKANKFLRSQRKKYKDNGVNIKNNNFIIENWSTWNGGCPDEIYPITWFIKLYGKPSSPEFKKNIKLQETTWIEWDISHTHPYIINNTQLKKWRKNICVSNSIFARKFNKSTAKKIGMNC
jgi:hypothetical protein